MKELGTLDEGMIHPSAHIAMDFLKEYLIKNSPFTLIESLASCAIEGNKIAEICGETLRRFLAKEPISDRYLMGLCWLLWKMESEKEKS